jgi:hypothetical protein
MTMTITSGRVLGVLRTESATHDDLDGLGTPARTFYRPESRPLLNDGKWHHWMIPGEDYELEHDGVGWRVTAQSWSGGHTYRLATKGTFEMADDVPTASGVVELVRGQRYRLVYTHPYQWELQEATDGAGRS